MNGFKVPDYVVELHREFWIKFGCEMNSLKKTIPTKQTLVKGSTTNIEPLRGQSIHCFTFITFDMQLQDQEEPGKGKL